MSRAVLVDTTLCIGCRGCQVACKQENDNPPEQTRFFSLPGGYQNPPLLSSKTFSVVTFNEVDVGASEPKWVFARRQCMHCLEPSCVAACLVGALRKNPEGAVTYDESKCIGCRYCQLACPFGVPSLEWDKTVAFIRKCTFCFDRATRRPPPEVLNEGFAAADVLDGPKLKTHAAARHMPACVSACPTGALRQGERDELIVEAHRRIQASPGRYVNHVYGEKEVGGTSWMYLAAVPFGSIGLPAHLSDVSHPSYTATALGIVGPQILAVGALLGGFHWFTERRNRVAAAAEQAGKDKATP